MKKRKFIRINIILVLCNSFIFLSCSLAPCLSDSGLDFVMENPKPEFLVGKYKLDNRTLEYEIFKDSGDVELVINKDHTFQILKLPIEGAQFGVFNEKKNIRININREWKTFEGKNDFLSRENSIFHVSYNHDYNDSDSMGYGGSWKIYEKGGKPVIFYILGDPDSCEAVRYIKTAE